MLAEWLGGAQMSDEHRGHILAAKEMGDPQLASMRLFYGVDG